MRWRRSWPRIEARWAERGGDGGVRDVPSGARSPDRRPAGGAAAVTSGLARRPRPPAHHPRPPGRRGVRRRLGGRGRRRRRPRPAAGAADRAARRHPAGGDPRHQQAVLGLGHGDERGHVRPPRPARLAHGAAPRRRRGRSARRPGPSWPSCCRRTPFTPIVLVALVGVGLYTWRRPELGLVNARAAHRAAPTTAGRRRSGWSSARTTASSGRGPARSSSSPWSACSATASSRRARKAKIANLVTNLAALAVFAAHGTVLWGLGLSMGAANLLGGYLGARTAIARGNRVRPPGVPARRRRPRAQAGRTTSFASGWLI